MSSLSSSLTGQGSGLRQQRAAELRASAEGGTSSPRRVESESGRRSGAAAAGLGKTTVGSTSGMGLRQQKAAELKAEAEAQKQTAQAESVGEEEAAEQSGGPVGNGEHVVQAGECTSSIAKETGHFWETIWDDPANSQLREVRQNPNVLLEDDRVTVPPIEPKYEAGHTEERHRFVRRGEPSLLRLRVLENDKPRSNEPYTLDIDGQTTLTGITDADGNIVIGIPGDAQQGKLVVGEGDKQLSYSLQLGQTDPVSTLRGVQQRLKNLGFDCGSESGVADSQTESALRAFQEKQGLSVTGQADAATRERLESVHGS